MTEVHTHETTPRKARAATPKDDPLVVNGVRFPNKTRANEARSIIEEKARAPQSPKAKRAKSTKAPKTTAAKAPGPAKAPTGKNAMVAALLARKAGATVAQIAEATGWKPSAARSSIAHLVAAGVKVTSTKDAGSDRVYRAAS